MSVQSDSIFFTRTYKLTTELQLSSSQLTQAPVCLDNGQKTASAMSRWLSSLLTTYANPTKVNKTIAPVHEFYLQYTEFPHNNTWNNSSTFMNLCIMRIIATLKYIIGNIVIFNHALEI